jgi:cardiolipin synthase
LFGEKRLGPGRVLHHNQLQQRYMLVDPKCDLPADLPECCREQSRLALKVGHMPLVNGNAVEFLTESPAMISRLSADIDAAKSQVHLLYYIFTPDATGMKIADALIRAAQRGVKCRLILDQYASRSCFSRHGFASQLQSAGIEVIAALPSSPLRRRDLRNHRKLAIIDDQIAYAGSQNLINPDYGGKRGGPWVDLSGRFTGPVVAEYATIFLVDWAFETNQELPALSVDQIPPLANGDPMQVVPTGPVSSAESFRRLFLGVVESAREQIVLTTPYFVPDEATILALLTAADRGVKITLLLPKKSDNIFTAAAGRAHYATLLQAGITIFLYRPGLIHSKSITVDGCVAIFGSANLDVRSFNLNFELTTLLYCKDAARRLYDIQQGYLNSSRQLDLGQWTNRPVVTRYVDAAVALISPLL